MYNKQLYICGVMNSNLTTVSKLQRIIRVLRSANALTLPVAQLYAEMYLKQNPPEFAQRAVKLEVELLITKFNA